MKILHILGELRPSGAEVMLRSAALVWHSESISLQILCTGAELGDYAPALSEAGYSIFHIPFRKKSFTFFSNFIRLVKAENYDVIQIHTERANFYYGLIAKMLGTPTVIRTIHSTFPFTGLLRLRRKCQRWAMRKLGIIQVSIGPSVAETERKYFQNPTIIIPNWYDDNYFRPPTQDERLKARGKIGVPPETVVFITVGNCSKVKNHSELIKALAKIQAKDFIYLHIGIEEDDSERTLAQQYEIENKIRFLGFQKEIRPYLWASDFFVMPSLYEGFGIAAIEGVASGVSSIFTRVPGLLDLYSILPGVEWAEPYDLSLFDAIQRLRSKPIAFRHKTSIEAANVVKNCWGTKIGAERYYQLYHNHLII
jgi:glycosyltransferase involved in cell wall biosynthesis